MKPPFRNINEPCVPSAEPPAPNSLASLLSPEPVPTSSLVAVIKGNTEVMQNLCIVLTMLMEMLDPDGLDNDDAQPSPRGEYLSSKPGKIYRKG